MVLKTGCGAILFLFHTNPRVQTKAEWKIVWPPCMCRQSVLHVLMYDHK